MKLHLKKSAQGPDWTHIELKDLGPDIGQHYEPPRHSDSCQDDEESNPASHSPLTDELLPLGEKLTDVLDYKDDLQQDAEIAQAVAHIPLHMDDVDIEMREVNPPLGFEPEFGCTGYDVNLVQPSDDVRLGSVSPVTLREDRMLDEDPQSRAPGTGRLGSDENPSRPITNKE